MRAEEKFFCSLSHVLGAQYVDTSKPKPKLVYASPQRNYYKNALVPELLSALREELGSTDDFSARTAPIDGMIQGHPDLGTRIVEFDEYQHFTHERELAIQRARHCLQLPFHSGYLQIIDYDHTRDEANRINKRTGFYKSVAGFRFEGGRMYQRAYFDTLKDYAHLSEKGQGLQPILRFSIPDFGVASESEFLRLDEGALRGYIKRILNKNSDCS